MLAAQEIRNAVNLASLASCVVSKPLSIIALKDDALPWRGAAMWAYSNPEEILALLEKSCYIGDALPCERPVQKFVASKKWRLPVTHVWRHDAQINSLEAAAFALGLRWFISNFG